MPYQKKLLLCLLLLFLAYCPAAWGSHSSLRNNTFNTLPDTGNPNIRTQLQNFADHELPQREGEHVGPYVFSGGVHGTSASLTAAAFATVAYVPERVSQAATAITYAAIANDVCWTIISSDNNGITGWTRVGSGNTGGYYYQCEGDTTPNEPTIPPNSLLLMLVRISGSAITSVEPRAPRHPLPIGYRYAFFSVRDYGAVGDDTAIDQDAVRATLTAAPIGAIIYFPPREAGAGLYRFNNMLTVAKNNTTFLCAPGVTLRWTALGASTFVNSAASTAAIRVNANDFRIEGCILRGPSVGVYTAEEHAIESLGTSTSARRSRLTLSGIECYDFGSRCLATQFVDQIRVENSYFHNIGYASAMLFSANDVWFNKNRVLTITPGTAGEMHGFSCTHYSVGYNLDPLAGSRRAVHPFCSNVIVSENIIEDVNWQGIDFHGAYDSVASNNRLYAVRSCISMGTGSGDASNYAGENNHVVNNECFSGNKNGTVSGRENLANGINLNGGATSPQGNSKAIGNIVIGYGIINNAENASIQAGSCDGCEISNNIIRRWSGVAIFFNAFINTINLHNNDIGPLATAPDTAAIAFRSVNATTGVIIATGNSVNAAAGTGATDGFRINGPTSRPHLSNNDLRGVVTNRYILNAVGFVRGTDLPTVITSINSTTIDVVLCTPGVVCNIQVSPTGPITLTNFTNAENGQIIVIHCMTAQTLTVNRDNARLQGGVNWTGNQYDSITLLNQGAANWREIARSGDVS